jgi:hypothetical protein
LDAIEFGKKERARSSKDGCTRWRYQYQGWAYVTDATSQHQVVRWQVSLSGACVFGKDPASAENSSDGENTRREIPDGEVRGRAWLSCCSGITPPGGRQSAIEGLVSFWWDHFGLSTPSKFPQALVWTFLALNFIFVLFENTFL